MNRIFVALIAACFIGPALAHANELSLDMNDSDHGEYHIEGHIWLPVAVEPTWSVLSDYDHIAEYVSSMEDSKVLQRAPNHLVVEQSAMVQVFLFSKHIDVTLDVAEQPMHRITFEDISHKNFKYYKGSWEIDASGPGLDVIYRLDAKRRFHAPGFMARSVMRREVQRLLTEVRQEILRRSNASRPTSFQ